jgi:hypothetical protein
LGVWEPVFVVLGGFLKKSFILGGHNFLISNPFLKIVSVSHASRGGVQVLFGQHKQ